MQTQGSSVGWEGSCKFRFVDAMKTLSKLDLKRVVRGHLGWRAAKGGARILRGGGKERRSEGGRRGKDKLERVERILFYASASLTLCCKVLPRLTVMSYSTDYNINCKPRCFGFREPRALRSFYRLYSTLRCGHFHITDGPCESHLQPSKIEQQSPQLYHHLHQLNHIHREALLISRALKFPPHSLDLYHSIPVPSVPSVSRPVGLWCGL